jgi:hypothetical protein
VDHPRPEPTVLDYDVGWITAPDERALDALARLQLAARRLGVTLRLYNACPRLTDLITLAGLTDVLIVDSGTAVSGVAMDGQIEQREEVRVDEEVHRGDEAR